MLFKGLLFISFLFLAGCIKPDPYPLCDRYREAQHNLQRLFVCHKEKQLDFYQALAYGLKYNLDYRVKLADLALQTGQLELAEFAMLPVINATGSMYNRSNDLATRNITTTGTPSNTLSTTPRSLRSARIPITWNLLELGMGYVKAKQQANRIEIAREQSRKQLQQLTQDVLAAYWEAYSAQQLLNNSKDFQRELSLARNKLNQALHDKTIPRDGILEFEGTVLEGKRQLVQLKNKYNNALMNLKRLTSLPLDCDYILLPPPSYLHCNGDMADLDFCKLDSISLVLRPELISQGYQAKIAKVGIQAAIFQALPGFTLNEGWNYNSNNFLVNNKWIDRSIDVAWNLLNLASLPTAIKTANEQIQYEKIKMMALTLTVLTETRMAYSHYQNLYTEYQIVKKQNENAYMRYWLAKKRRSASLASDQQVILAKIHWITTKMDENVILADLSTAMGLLYLSAGMDTLPLDGNNLPLDQTITCIKNQFNYQMTIGFKEYVNQTYEDLFC